MILRCKDGDLAVIIHDTSECSDNLGRIVEIKGPPRWGRGYELVCWRIRPISEIPLVVIDHGVIVREVVHWGSHVIHPDTWLMPIKNSGEEKNEISEATINNPLAVTYEY